MYAASMSCYFRRLLTASISSSFSIAHQEFVDVGHVLKTCDWLIALTTEKYLYSNVFGTREDVASGKPDLCQAHDVRELGAAILPSELWLL